MKAISYPSEHEAFFVAMPPNVLAMGLALLLMGSGMTQAEPVRIIFDTDMTTDCDDVGALAVLNHLADLNEARILACVANGLNSDKSIAAAISAINTYYGRPDIPIGTYQGNRCSLASSRYTSKLRDEFPHHAKPDDQQPKAVEVYRRTLVNAPDGSVTIVSVGFLVNLRDLIDSPADDICPLSGLELVKNKVKRLVIMGGVFPQGNTIEFNLSAGNSRAAPDAQYVVERWPTEILFSGGEIGSAISTGPSLIPSPQDDPVRRAYELFGALESGRQSWDLTAVLAAIRDPELYWHVVRHGYCKISPKGATEWVPNQDRHHAYLIPHLPPSDIAAILSQLMAAKPMRHPQRPAN